jgi:hypothetical protein
LYFDVKPFALRIPGCDDRSATLGFTFGGDAFNRRNGHVWRDSALAPQPIVVYCVGMNQRLNDTGTLLLAALLAGISTLGPFAIDTYMPSFPAIEQAFSVTPIAMQQTLSAYMVPFSVMTLFHGALSDSFGRRPVIVLALAMFGIASLGCALSQNLSQMLVFRGMQGMFAAQAWW